MAATVSLSKGVFAFRKNKTQKNFDNSCPSYWQFEEDWSDPQIQKITYANYQHCWSSVSKIIEGLFTETHSVVLKDLINYVRISGYTKWQNLFKMTDGQNRDIPAACLVTGVNMPDHATLFDNLTKSITETVSPHIARLSSGDCANIKAAIYKLTHSFMIGGEEIPTYDSDTEDLFFDSKSPKNDKIKKKQCNMTALASWYKESVFSQKKISKTESRCNAKSPNKRLKTSKDHNHVRPKDAAGGKELNVSFTESSNSLIVIVEDVESIPVQVLQDLILIASEYQNVLPFVFIFGVSTMPSYIHRHLSQEASSFITMETFQAQPSSLLLSEVIDRVLMSSDISFRVGGKVFKLLLDIFLFHDLSVKNFISGLKLCILEHFLRGQGTLLCCEKESRETIIKKQTSSYLNTLRSFKSYKKLEEDLSEDEKQKMREDKYFKICVLKYLDDLDDWYSTFCCLVKVLHCLVHSLPGNPLGKQIRELFSTCLNEHVTEMEEFESAWKLLAMTAKEELSPKLKEAIQIIEGCDKNAVLEELIVKLSKFDEKMWKDEIMEVDKETKPVSSPIDLKPSDRFNLREKLLGHQKSKVQTPFEILRKETLESLKECFIAYLKPFHTKPFNEIFFFDSVACVKYQLLGSLRATITTGLSNPQKYLQCACCKLDDSDNLLVSLPDLSLCYKLHLECGTLINLYDWLQAFVTVVSGNEDDDENAARTNRKSSKGKKKVDETLQARFIQSVAELQLLGFIKPTKKKTDHVQRLTYGGC